MRLIYSIFKIFPLFLFVFLSFAIDSYGQSYGLAFSSHEVFQDKRTGLDLSPDKTLCFNDGFDISFDLSFLPNKAVYFGYIIRIVEDDKRNIDLVYDEQSSKNHFSIIVGEKLSKIAFDISPEKLFNQWNKINIKIDAEHDRITLASGRALLVQSGLNLKKNACYKILFGVNNYKQFQTTDIPPMKLRDIRISQNNIVKYNWPLSEERGLLAHEIIAQNDAGVVNPVWVSALHHDWQLAKDITVNGIASVGFDAGTEQVYIVSSDSIYRYDVGKAKLNSNAYTNGKIDLTFGGQSVFNLFDHNLYSFLPDQKFVSRYDLQSRNWDKKFTKGDVTEFWHANKLFSVADSSLYLFGGYGHLVYKNRVQQYHLKSGTWNDVKVNGDFFMPRYLSALGATAKGDTAYILGGYGNSSGQQILNPQNIYDMMRFVVKDKTFKKLFDLKVSSGDFALANSLVIDSKTKTYYGLIFPQHKYNSSLQLIAGSLLKPDYQMVGSAIPYQFHDTHSFADLFFCPATGRFTAITLLRSETNQTKVSIYTLLGPPYAADDKSVAIATNTYGWYYIGIALVLLIVVLVYLSKYRTGKKQASTSGPIPVVPNNDAKEVNQVPAADPVLFSHIHFKNSILLFGDLQLFDAEGVDITKYFTPLIKELFLVILLYSIRWGRGLSSEKLNEILWYDKSAESARNNRSVNIAKLKSLLDKMGHCKLSKETGYWKIDIDYNYIYVDYYNYLSIVKDKKELDIQKIKHLSDIIQRGNFLPHIEYEWLDTFKSEISNDVIDTYLHFAQSGTAHDPEFLIELTNFIFFFDPVNEEAMVIKCKALSALGKHSLAKNTFETFIKEYKIIYNEEFKKDFHAILE